ncbi:dihydrolipoamide acetyltransferase family protein [Ktedonobacter racemifer]|uniref:Dihydrolipoamide acetyltransferase component of pyruvate dehydrogenase complex n=1 Tax=Ktedonobacter racemifer DSM 44963 TaxID=485913 RepID=D6TBK6_KTERA|nr:dihydrolipoamide acetyltransferase family protein [Ktedonobacter racemifer]EFH87990.1 Dihydrolipoyllysine-residue acetyltransferase [Ktedonobacter racemifer DSM 44963]
MVTTQVILPALGMSQDTGKIITWLKASGEQVTKGEPLVEIETDKATVEIEAPADGMLDQIIAGPGEEIPVGQVIATILAPGEKATSAGEAIHVSRSSPGEHTRQPSLSASPLASRIAAEHNLDLSLVQAEGKRIQKADVMTYLRNQQVAHKQQPNTPIAQTTPRLTMASPKARRLAAEQGKNLAQIKGSGPGGAVLATDVVSMPQVAAVHEKQDLPLSTIWRIMAERTTQSWTSVPHFYLVREVNASRLEAWYQHRRKHTAEQPSYTDLLVKIVALALRTSPRLNASWSEGTLYLEQDIHIGLAMATEHGLVVPVIHQADTLSLQEITRRRRDLVARALARKLRPEDLREATFTISNLGMYNIDAFNAIIQPPQVAILAVGRIAERVVSVQKQPMVQPTMMLTLSCDHRAVDGALGAKFLSLLADLIEEPLGLLQ